MSLNPEVDDMRCTCCICLGIFCLFGRYGWVILRLLRSHMTPTPFCTHVEILGPIPGSVLATREWRSICDHAGSLTRLIIVKPYLEFSSFSDALSLIVPIATMYYLRG